MIRWLRRLRFRPGAPDPDAFLADLRRAGLGRSYTQGDRYRDFRAVFHGHSTPEQGRRVLWQLLDGARIYRPVKADDPYETYFRDGERNMGLRIIRTMHAEPDGAVTVQREEGT